jgi:hypothetical protein
MVNSSRASRLCAALLCVALIASTVPFAGAAGSMYGTIQASGTAWVASTSASDWARLSRARPLVAGDRLRTGTNGYLLADLGEAGVVGLYGDAEISATDVGSRPMIDVHKGKVAFHFSPKSKLMLAAKGAGIASDVMPADGYVEYGKDGVPVVVVENGALTVQLAGVDRQVASGERLALRANSRPEPVPPAASGGESKKAAAAAMGNAGENTYGGISPAGWTAIAGVAALTGGAIAVGLSDNANGSDNNGSN